MIVKSKAGASVVQFSISFHLLQLRCGRGEEASEVTFVQYMEVPPPSDMV